ncbi:MAG: pyridoxine 5'-phosphate synthase [Myxococcales bacterium]|nr:pyridoxine 5'-phosphate synthase [Myxococcota bacterium]MDW8281146.1 pyridoxine 5'-phosphate synthase [Myxococcales bacterium]
MPIALYVNIDHVATLRQARGTQYPDPVWAAALCELAGADGITVHLREDRRHIQDRDLHLLRQTVRGTLNLEIAPLPELIDLACALKPNIVTLVPERRQERTTEGGLNVAAQGKELEPLVRRLQQAGISVSLFIAPDLVQVRAAEQLKVPRIELHTGYYCEATLVHGQQEVAKAELERLAIAAETGVGLGLHIAAGHGLDYPNVRPVAALPGVEELNIGHAVVARAVMVGMQAAVREMIEILRTVS